MKRTLLENDITLFREDGSSVKFHIMSYIGRGASCIVYHAVCEDNTEHLLKEYYPRNLELERNSEGMLIVPEDKKDSFEMGLRRFRYGNECQKEVRMSEQLKNFTSNVQGYFHANHTEYIDMAVFSGKIYSKVENESLYNLMRRMKVLAQVIGNYHHHGLLHLDIKPDNIFVRPEGETVEDVMLFDFDSVIPKNDVLTSSALSYTKDWAAPEQLLPYRRHEICEATDIYAIGEIIFTKIFGRHPIFSERRSFAKYKFEREAEIFKNVNPKIFPLLADLLSHAICGVVKKRYQTTAQLIEKLDEIITVLSSTNPYLISNVSIPDTYESKNMKTLTKIHAALEKEARYFIKSTPKRNITRYAMDYVRCFGDCYDAVVLLDCRKGLVEMFEDIPIINFDCEKISSPFKRTLRTLNALEIVCDYNVLLILDHFSEQYLVDSRYFDMQEVSEVCSRLMLLNATILVNGSFDTDNFFKKEHYRHYHELLYTLAETSYHKRKYEQAEHYIKKAISTTDFCAEQYAVVFKEKDSKLLDTIRIDDWWCSDSIEPFEEEVDSFLEQFLDCVDDID